MNQSIVGENMAAGTDTKSILELTVLNNNQLSQSPSLYHQILRSVLFFTMPSYDDYYSHSSYHL